MKKLSLGHQTWLLRRQSTAQFRQRRSAGRLRHRAAVAATSSPVRWRTVVIQVPPKVVAERSEDRVVLLSRLSSIVKALSQPRTKVKLDFSRTPRVFPGGMLLLLSYVELLLAGLPAGRLTAKCPPNSLPAQLMRHFGIADALGIPPASSRPAHASVVGWRYLTGTNADCTLIDALLQSYQQATSAAIPEGLFEVLSEALVNVRHHAYKESRVPSSMQRWWLFARYDEPLNGEDGSLYVAVYDIGVGIQTSIRAKPKLRDWIDQQLELLPALKHRAFLHQSLLRQAIEGPRSGTGQDFRGKGLPEMMNFVKSSGSGKLSIVSGRAQYTCSASGSLVSGCEAGLLGTLILWNIQLKPKELLS